MIPISKDDLITWTDEDNGNVYELRPAVGRDEFALIEAVEKLSFNPDPYKAEAEKRISEKKATAKLTGKKRDDAIRTEAYIVAGKDKFDREEMELMYRAIDSLVVSCTPKGKDKIVFQNNASEHFNRLLNTGLFWGVYRSNTLTGEDRKNS